MITRPDLDDYAKLLEKLTDVKHRLKVAEDQKEIFAAKCLRKAKELKVKTRDYDYVKIIGNDEDDEKMMIEFRKVIADLSKQLGQLYNQQRIWEAHKDLYKAETYLETRSKGW
jgi:hypothetical protein